MDLKKPYENLLASHIVKAIHSLQTVQALLILITWPTPVNAQPESPTWNYCGLVANTARLIGIHEPGREKEYGFPRATSQDVKLRTRTWMHIFHRCTM